MIRDDVNLQPNALICVRGDDSFKDISKTACVYGGANTALVDLVTMLTGLQIKNIYIFLITQWIFW